MRRVVLLSLLAVAAPALAHADEAPPAVSELVVVAPSAGEAGVAAGKLGSTVESLTAEDFARSSALSVTEAIQRRLPGANVTDTRGNGYVGDVEFRGFSASGVQGAPQGLAVYLNGQRLNEPFGETVNWDLVPQAAVARADLMTNAPAFGLNALGGALSIRLKDGFSAAGGSARIEGGSFGAVSGAVEQTWRRGDLGAYVALDGGREDGWRDRSPSKVARGYADLGWEAGGAKLHLSLGASSSNLGVIGPTPADMLAEDRSSVFTSPQTTKNRAGLAALNGSMKLSETVSLEGSLHLRAFEQRHADGNPGEFERCSGNAANPLFNTLCLQDDGFPRSLRPPAAAFQLVTPDGRPIACPPPTSAACNTTPYAILDASRTRSTTTGGSLQLVDRSPRFGRPNVLTLGAAFEASTIRFAADSTLGLLQPDLVVATDAAIPGAGQVIRAAGAVGYAPVNLAATNRNAGLYVTDTLDLTDRLFLTLGGRWNLSRIAMEDRTGLAPDLTAKHRFSRFDPAASLAWKAREDLTLYAGLGQATRVPTPLELGCSDPDRPCLLENALVADPPLKPVTATTYEAGARGATDLGGGRLSWRIGLFQSDNRHDIVALASALPGRGYYANVPGTRRRGLDADFDYVAGRWSLFAGYSHVDATYRFDALLPSPNNPAADDDGFIAVQKGDRLGGVPAERFKAGVEVQATARLRLALDVVGVGPQYLSGDEGNDNPKLAGSWVANLGGAWTLSARAEAFVRVDNLTDERYASFGAFFDPEEIGRVSPSPLPDDPDLRTLSPGAPRRVSAGLRLRF